MPNCRENPVKSRSPRPKGITLLPTIDGNCGVQINLSILSSFIFRFLKIEHFVKRVEDFVRASDGLSSGGRENMKHKQHIPFPQSIPRTFAFFCRPKSSIVSRGQYVTIIE